LSPTHILENVYNLSMATLNVIGMQQVHEVKVVCVGKKDAGRIIKNCDGLITNSPEVILKISVADCLPIFFYNPSTNSIGLVHAGWRGLYKGIIKNAINLMNKKFGANPEDIFVFIGPHICQKHYEIKSDVYNKFKNYPKAIKKVKEKIYLDLGEIAGEQLTKFGVSESNIQIDENCTFEDKTLFSHRRGNAGKATSYLFRLPDSS